MLRARAHTHFVRDYPGPLSIKSVTEGTVTWKSGGRSLVVDRDSFLILNHGEPYSLDIESRHPVGTLCVFFQPGFVESVQASLTREDPDPEPEPALFTVRLQPREGRILPRMEALAAAAAVPESWVDEQFLKLAADLALLDRGVRRRARFLPALRPATRQELLRRVLRGQEFLHAHAAGGVSLAQIARESCLSPFHFHRAFTRAFGRTPHEYLTSLRLDRARRLLETAGLTVTEAAAAVGFESLPSFSTLYRRAYGVPPSQAKRNSPPRPAAPRSTLPGPDDGNW